MIIITYILGRRDKNWRRKGREEIFKYYIRNREFNLLGTEIFHEGSTIESQLGT